jgi:hypothetical protein
MRYINDDTARLGPQSKLQYPIYHLIGRNQVVERLKARGYRYVHCNTNYEATRASPVADVSLSPVPRWLLGEWTSVLLRSTALRYLAPDVAETHLQTFAMLRDVPRLRGPTFTFAHIILPHNPYVFDREGNVQRNIPLSLQFRHKGGDWHDRKPYVEQLLFLNSKIEELVDHLVQASPVPPIIILQADHGTATRVGARRSPDARRGFIRERMAILNAYYGPPSLTSRLYPSISPVNSFRVLFSSCFGEDLDVLPDRQYYSWYGRPYRHEDVTAWATERDESTERVTRR